MKRFSFKERYDTDELYKDYDQARLDLLGFVRESLGEVVCLDFSGITHLGFSYSKATVGAAVRDASADPSEHTRIVASVEPGLNLEELEAALEKFSYGLVVVESPETDPAKGRVVGKVAEHLQATWQVVAQSGPVSTAELAEEISESLQNTNQRLKKLDAMGLLRRAKVTSPTGGVEWVSRIF